MVFTERSFPDRWMDTATPPLISGESYFIRLLLVASLNSNHYYDHLTVAICALSMPIVFFLPYIQYHHFPLTINFLIHLRSLLLPVNPFGFISKSKHRCSKARLCRAAVGE